MNPFAAGNGFGGQWIACSRFGPAPRPMEPIIGGGIAEVFLSGGSVVGPPGSGATFLGIEFSAGGAPGNGGAMPTWLGGLVLIGGATFMPGMFGMGISGSAPGLGLGVGTTPRGEGRAPGDAMPVGPGLIGG